MDISNNNITEEELDDLPELIPIDPPSADPSPFFANLLNQFQQQIPYTMNLDRYSLQLGTSPIISPISRRYYGRTTYLPINNHIIDIQDGSAAILPPASPSLSSFSPFMTTQTFPINTTTTENLSSVMEQSFQEKARYKQVLSDKGEEQITYKKYSEEDDPDAICAITREQFSIGDDIAVLPCNHVFCKEAINKWLQTKKAECPICRFKLDSKEVKEERERASGLQTLDVPRPQRMRQMLFDLINQSLDAEEDDAIQRAIIASLQEVN